MPFRFLLNYFVCVVSVHNEITTVFTIVRMFILACKCFVFIHPMCCYSGCLNDTNTVAAMFGNMDHQTLQTLIMSHLCGTYNLPTYLTELLLYSLINVLTYTLWIHAYTFSFSDRLSIHFSNH